MKSDVVVIILARGGSKSVPRKNLANVGGLSLLARAIRTSQAAKVRSPASRGNLTVHPRVYVSTDDGMIAAETIANGAEVIQRPGRLATETSQGTDALRHALGLIDGVNVFAMVQCTAPMMSTADVVNCFHALECGYEMTVCTVPFSGTVLRSNGQPLSYEIGEPENRQQREPMQQVAGSVWTCQPEYLDKPWYSGLVGCVPSEYPRCLDVDTEEDLNVARLVISGQQSERAEGLERSDYAASQGYYGYV